MRLLIRKIASLFGITTSYHVAGFYTTGGNQGVVSMTCKIKPWLHQDNYRDLVSYLEGQAQNPDGETCITSISRLGV